MNKTDSMMLPDVNQLIMEKLRAYPGPVAELAIQAVQLSENQTEATVFECLQELVRKYARKYGIEP